MDLQVEPLRIEPVRVEPLGVEPLRLDGSSISLRTLLQIGTGAAAPVITAAAREQLVTSRRVLEDNLKSGSKVYGCNTGVGAMKDTIWIAEALDEFSLDLAQAHHFGVGPRLPASVVRAALAIRINTALTGRVGCSPELIDALLILLNADYIPVVQSMGSIGCGDIGLMGQIAGGLTGAGAALHHGREMPMREALAACGLEGLRMKPRDTLASLSLNAIGYASAAFAIHSAGGVIRRLLATGLCAAGALGASRNPWLAASVIAIPEHAETGVWLIEASKSWPWTNATHVQDPLSLRMMPQIFGSALETLCAAAKKLTRATHFADDNPVTIGDEVLTSGGSLPIDVTLALQTAQIALAHVARNVFNRCALLVNGGRGGLPINLVPAGSIATGLGPTLKLAGDLFTRVLSMSSAISPQALVVANGIEDEAAFLPLIVERFSVQVEALGRLAALEALLGAEALDIKAETAMGPAGLVYAAARKHAQFRAKGRTISESLGRIESELYSAQFTRQLIRTFPMAERDDLLALDVAAPRD